MKEITLNEMQELNGGIMIPWDCVIGGILMGISVGSGIGAMLFGPSALGLTMSCFS